jgi:hypothetical protein
MCLSAIAWSGLDTFHFLFSYEDTRDEFEIPHDLSILAEVFRCPDGSYADANAYWRATTSPIRSGKGLGTNGRGGKRKSRTSGRPTASSPIATKRSNGRATFHSPDQG